MSIQDAANRAAVTRREQGAQQNQSIASFIKALTPEISRALPKHLDGERMARLALTVVRKTPKLADCTPESFAGALLTAAALGLEPGVNDEVYLVPYGRECQLIVGFKGLTKLFYQHPMASHIDAQAVFANDEFDYQYGTDPFLRHKPARGDRGDVVEYYAVATLSNGASAFVVLSPEEIKALRQGKVGPDSRFKAGDPQRWMERKTAIRQLVKLLPKSTSLMAAAAADERVGSDLRRELEVPPAVAQIATSEHGSVDVATGELVDEEAGYGWPPEDGDPS